MLLQEAREAAAAAELRCCVVEWSNYWRWKRCFCRWKSCCWWEKRFLKITKSVSVGEKSGCCLMLEWLLLFRELACGSGGCKIWEPFESSRCWWWMTAVLITLIEYLRNQSFHNNVSLKQFRKIMVVNLLSPKYCISEQCPANPRVYVIKDKHI